MPTSFNVMMAAAICTTGVMDILTALMAVMRLCVMSVSILIHTNKILSLPHNSSPIPKDYDHPNICISPTA